MCAIALDSELCFFLVYILFCLTSSFLRILLFFLPIRREIVHKMFCQKHLSAIYCHSSGAVTPLNHIYLHINVAYNLLTTTHIFTHTRACAVEKICFTRGAFLFHILLLALGLGIQKIHTHHSAVVWWLLFWGYTRWCSLFLFFFLFKFAHVNNNISTLRVPFGVNFVCFSMTHCYTLSI